MSKKTALIIMFILMSVVLVFHILVYIEIIPYDIVWAGKVNSVKEMKIFESVSISINLFMSLVLFVKYKKLEHEKKTKFIDILIWGFVILFSLNTIGNLFAKSLIELLLGTSLTLVSAILCFIIVKK